MLDPKVGTRGRVQSFTCCTAPQHNVAMTGVNLGLNDTVGCIFLAAMFASVCALTYCAPSSITKADDLTEILHCRLYGCCLGQVVYYFRNFGREDKYIKYLAWSFRYIEHDHLGR